MSLVWEGALVGVFGGFVVTFYRIALSWAEGVVRSVTGHASQHPLLIAAWFCALAAMMFVVGFLVRWEPDTSGSGIPQVDAEVMGAKSMSWHRVLAAKFVEGTLGALSGLSLGREGPSVMLGGMAGKAVSRMLKRGRGEERLLVTCGAGAGMAAAFHAPLTGVMFTIEEIHKTFDAALIISVMCAAIVGDYVSSQVLGLTPVVAFVLPEYLPHELYGLLVPFGIGMGIVGAGHNLGMFALQDAMNRIRAHAPYLRLAIPFALAGVVAFTVPELMCGGDAILEELKQPGRISALAILGLLLGKYLYTGVCFGSGAPGGTLFPLVVMGALSGVLIGKAYGACFGLSPVYLGNFLVLGIAGMFASCVRAPVTAVVLAFELTGSLQALLSLSIVSILAYVTANLLRVDAYYEHLLGRLLGVSTDEAHTRWGADGKQLQNYVIEAGSELDGKLVRDVAWPERVLVVTISRYGADIVPQGSTRLEANDRLLVVLDETSLAHAESRVKELCRCRFEAGK